MATGLCNPASSPLRLAAPPSHSPPRVAAFVAVGGGFSGSPLRTKPHRLRPPRALRGGGSLAGGRLLVLCGIPSVSQADFGEAVLKSEVPVLVEFVADWTLPKREYADRLKVVKIDHDANPQLIEEYKVYGLPALILFKDGQMVPESRREGAVTKAKLKEYLDPLLESIAVS